MEHQDALDVQQQFADDQASGLGATDTPKILGLSKYGTALTVWESKVRPTGKDPSSLPAWLGMQLQGTVAELYTQATGHRVRAATQHYRHATIEFLVCHLDYKVWGQPTTLVECKTRAYMKGWGDDGSTDIPPEVWTQVQHELMVTDAKECHVAVLFGHHTFRVYPIPRDETFIAHLEMRLINFWNLYVLTKTEPPAGPTDGPWLNKAFPQDDGDVLTATSSQSALVKELADAEELLEQHKLAVEEKRNIIKQALGDHEGFYSPMGTVLWKTSKERHFIDWQAVARAIALEQEAEDGRVDTLAEEHTNIKPGVRRFTFSKYAGDTNG